ncbi:MAG: site-specific integrase [Acidobacteria bacterium]|nr:site-specific integrase [Acidobacteriota bacterium]
MPLRQLPPYRRSTEHRVRPIKKHRGIFERPKGSGFWWICYFDQYGRKQREKVGMKAAALIVYQQRKTEIRQGKFEREDVKRKHQHATVSEIIKDRLEVSKALKAADDEEARLESWKEKLGDRSARGVTPADIEKARREFIASRERRPKPATVNRYLAALKTAFSFALENGKVETNPVRTVKMECENNERIRFLTRDEEARLLGATPTKYHPLITVAIHTGLRKSEMLKLEWRDIDLKRNQLTVRESKSGKGRIVPLSETAAATFRELSKVRLIDNVYVFPGEIPGERMKDLPRYWEQYRKKAGLEDLHWHDLRHTFASRLVMVGVDLYTVSKLLGHHDVKMTTRYAHLSPDHLLSAVGVLDRVSENQVTLELTPKEAVSL